MAVEMIEIKVMVPKECHELFREVVGLVNDIRARLADGYQHTDIVGAISDAISRLIIAVEGYDKMDDEFKEQLEGVVKAAGLSLADLLKKPVPNA